MLVELPCFVVTLDAAPLMLVTMSELDVVLKRLS
jgi:hypothetical protein